MIHAARFVHWVQNDPAHRTRMVEIAVSQMRMRMHQYAQRYTLNGASDAICLVIADIRHQGRAPSSTILAALQSAKPLDALRRRQGKLPEPRGDAAAGGQAADGRGHARRAAIRHAATRLLS